MTSWIHDRHTSQTILFLHGLIGWNTTAHKQEIQGRVLKYIQVVLLRNPCCYWNVLKHSHISIISNYRYPEYQMCIVCADEVHVCADCSSGTFSSKIFCTLSKLLTVWVNYFFFLDHFWLNFGLCWGHALIFLVKIGQN